MDWNAPQHSYEEVREVVIDVLMNAGSTGVDQFMGVLEYVGREFARRHLGPSLPTGMAYPGATSQLHPRDSDTVVEVVWDLFRQGIITFGLNSSNPGWPWLRLSRFGQKALEGGYHNRFHDTNGYLRLLGMQVPDISEQAVIYLEDAVASFYADCLLACVVMLGVAAEVEFLRLIDVAIRNAAYGKGFEPANKAPVVRQKILKFQAALVAILPSLQPKKDFEDLDTNLSLIQSVIRIARNDVGHPSGNPAPPREQVYIYLQLFIPFAKQLAKLRAAFA